MNNKKTIDIKDLTRAQALKQGESLVTSKYIITCQEPLKSYLIEFRKARQ